MTQELIQRIQKEIENDSDFTVCSNKHENDESCYTTASQSGTAARGCRAEAGIPDQDRAREEGACRAGPACTEEAGRADPGCRAAVEEAC